MNGAPEKPMTPARPPSSAPDEADRLEGERDLGRVERPEPLDIGRGPDRLVDDRAHLRLDSEPDSHRLERQHDVGEEHGRVHPQLVHGHQGDLGAQLGRLGQLQDAVALPKLAIGGEAAAGLAHEPDRRCVDRLVPACPDESVVHARNARRAASRVASTSSSPWAIDTNHASNWDGGRRTPRSSIAPKNRL